MKRIGYLLLPVLLSAISGKGQFPSLDRARQNIYGASSDKERLKALVTTALFKNSMCGDTIYHYANWARKLAIQLGDEQALAWAEYSLISGDITSGKTDSVIPRIEGNKLFRDIKKRDPDLYFKIQLLKANVLNRTNRLPEALELQLQLLREAETGNHVLSRLFLINYIGATYLNTTGQLESARKIWLSGLDIIREANNPAHREIEAYILSNLSLYHLGNYYTKPDAALRDTCLLYLNRTINLCRENETMAVLASVLSYRASLYGRLKMYKEAEADFKEAVSIRSKIGDPLYMSVDLKNLAFFYFERNEPDKCLAVVNEGLQICEKFHIRETTLELLKFQAGVYKMKEDQVHYTATLEKILLVTDTAIRVNSAEKIAVLQTQYEVQKKEALIAKQKLDLFKRNGLLYSAGAAALLLALFFIYRFRKYRKRQQQLMEEKKQQHTAQLKEAEEKERKRIAAELHDNLGVQANAILHNSNLLATGNPDNGPIVTDLQETAKEMLLNLRETLWAMKNSDINGVELWLRIINFMQQMGRHYTGIHFKVLGTPPKDFMITANRALHIVLVIQESVNNSVKHAGAGTIEVLSTPTPQGWNISIQDDGNGFDLEAAMEKNDRYGLQHINERAAAGEFSCNIETAYGKGTKTTLQIGQAHR